MKKLSVIVVGFLCLLVAAGLIMPAIAKISEFGLVPNEVLISYTVGVLLAACGVVVVFKGAVSGRRIEK